MISASARSCLPLSSSSGRPSAASRSASSSLLRIVREPISTGRPARCIATTSATTARYFDSASAKNRGGSVSRRLGFRKGIWHARPAGSAGGTRGGCPAPCRSCRRSCCRAGRIAAERSCAAVRNSGEVSSPSLASTAWCSPSRHVRSAKMRPVNSSTSITRPSCDDVIDIPLVEMLRRQGLLDVFGPRPIEGKTEPARVVFVNRLLAGPGERDRAGLGIDHEVLACQQRRSDLPGLQVGLLATWPVRCYRSRPAADRPRRSAPSRSRR